MAVSVLNEINVSGQNDDLLSPFMRPSIYFKVSGAGAVTSPEAEIEIAGSGETVTFDATFIQTLSSEHYFHVDLSNIMKYLLRYFDSDDKPDDLDFKSTEGPSLFDYFRAVDIDIYFERGTADEQTLTITKDWIYLANQMPQQYGFNLVNISNSAQLSGVKFKWSKDTYNAFFFWHPGGEMSIATSLIEITSEIGSFNNVGFDTFTETVPLQVHAVDAAGSVYIESQNAMASTNGKTKYYIIDLTVNSGTANIKVSLWGSVLKSNEVTLTAGRNYVALTPTITADLTMRITADAATNFDIVINPKGYYQFKFSKSTGLIASGLNTLTVQTPNGSATFTIDYDPDCTYVNLCWQHPQLGYVSYRFEGIKTETYSWKKGDELNKFLTTMADVNTLKEVLGYDAEKRVSVQTKAEDDYYSQLQELAGARHAYLFVGAAASADSTRTWVECQPSGGSQIKPSRAKQTFVAELMLPEHFNIQL